MTDSVLVRPPQVPSWCVQIRLIVRCGMTLIDRLDCGFLTACSAVDNPEISRRLFCTSSQSNYISPKGYHHGLRESIVGKARRYFVSLAFEASRLDEGDWDDHIDSSKKCVDKDMLMRYMHPPAFPDKTQSYVRPMRRQSLYVIAPTPKYAGLPNFKRVS